MIVFSIVPAVDVQPLYAIVDGTLVPVPEFVFATYSDGLTAIRPASVVSVP